jgi:hypothetical protein
LDEAGETRDFAIARAILGYMVEHRDAKDTLEGIDQWWLLKEEGERSLSDVADAIALLRSMDLIVETRRGSLPPFYGLNRDRQEEIAKWLGRE